MRRHIDPATSVSVSVWTLTLISLERYFAICQPLRSRSWQTLSHSYKMIAVVWVSSLILMSPILLLSKLKPLQTPGNLLAEQPGAYIYT
uniref:G-protein coupled receptors family 1 profile domain-containing protein n=1 Tax=Strigamia maritima TaxID=126957 RepID=T1J459_STRMM